MNKLKSTTLASSRIDFLALTPVIMVSLFIYQSTTQLWLMVMSEIEPGISGTQT